VGKEIFVQHFANADSDFLLPLGQYAQELPAQDV